MPFAEGTYKHEQGFVVMVKGDMIFLSPDAPAFVNMKDFFDQTKWTKIAEDEK